MTTTFLLDSGAWTAFTKKTSVNIDEYSDFLEKNKKYFLSGCFNLDVIHAREAKDKISYEGKDSYLNWKRLRDAGHDTIPIYHIGEDEKWLEMYMKQSDYIAIGAIANLHTKVRLVSLDRIWNKYLRDENGNPVIKVHGLGLTSARIILRYPWYSVDSSVSVIVAAYGKVYVPKLVYQKGIGWKPDYENMFTLTVSRQGKHDSHTSASFFSLPTGGAQQTAYRDYFLQMGYQIGEVQGRHLLPTRKDKRREREGRGRNPLKPFKELDRSSPESEKKTDTLASDWELRYQYNLDFWNTVVQNQHLTKTKIHHVVSARAHFPPIRSRGLCGLMSYYYLKGGGGLLDCVKEAYESKEGRASKGA